MFDLSLPTEVLTKSYSDGKSATDLYYAVYDAGTGEYLKGSATPITMTSLTQSVNIPLVLGYKYDIVFWAQSPDADYYEFAPSAKTVTVKNYDTAANDENRDAFYRLVEDYSYTTTSTNVELYRPFAQINFLAADYDQVANSVESKVSITNIPNVLNVLTGEASGNVNADFKAAKVPYLMNETLELDGKNYTYVSMNYVLANKEKANFDEDVTGVFYYGEENNLNNVSLSVPNVPYQRNYRTNIIVNKLFTGDAQFSVEIVPTYGPNDDQNHEHVYVAQ